MISLDVIKRGKADTIASVINKGMIPAVFYGKKEPSTPIAIPMVAFNKVWKQAGESSVVVLKGDDIEVEALIHDIDYHPVTGVPRHVDFYAFEKGKKVQVTVPIEFVGVSEAVKSLGGTLVKVLHGIEIEAFPKDLPHEIKIDIGALAAMDSVIYVKDVTLPNGVEAITKGDEIVVSIAEPMKEIVEEAPVDLTAIEVEKKGKTDEEGAAAAEAGAPEKTEKKAEKGDKKGDK